MSTARANRLHPRTIQAAAEDGAAFSLGRGSVAAPSGLWPLVLPVAMWLVLGDLLANSETKPHTMTSVTFHLVFASHEIIPF